MRVSRNSKYIIPYLEKFYESTSYYSYSLIMIAIFFKGGDRVSIDNSLPKEF